MERAARGHRNQGAKILARTRAHSLQNVFFSFTSFTDWFISLSNKELWVKGNIHQGWRILRGMPDGGEGSEGKKHGICVYDARVGVREEGEHFPQR